MSGKRQIRAVPTPKGAKLTESVRETVEKLTLNPEDVAVAQLAVEYAETIERAADLAEEAANLPYDPDTAVMVARLKQRVEAHTVMADVGPKLLAALDALGATPKARAAAGKPAPASGGSALAKLRGA
ncbi:hypothetical protein [Pseudonocardia sp. NPDC049154]|uniref:terminase small subunit n=1 Tax=Pseudonocardia sp. NPDC049154 TaxID=3155501 RepID=UPI0033F4A377